MRARPQILQRRLASSGWTFVTFKRATYSPRPFCQSNQTFRLRVPPFAKKIIGRCANEIREVGRLNVVGSKPTDRTLMSVSSGIECIRGTC